MGCLRRVIMMFCLGFDVLAFAFIFLALLNGVAQGETTMIGRTDAFVMLVASAIGLLATLLLGTILWLVGSGGRGPAKARIQELERQNQRLRDALGRPPDLAAQVAEAQRGTDPRSIEQEQA